jgi:undecaprenyl diphosphate synthase
MILTPSLPSTARTESAIPRHVAIILDDDATSAAPAAPHEPPDVPTGVRNIRRLLLRARERDIKYLTLFPLGPQGETRRGGLMERFDAVLESLLDNEVPSLSQDGVRIRHVGDRDSMSRQLNRRITAAARLTRCNRDLTVVVAIGYSGRADIVGAIRAAGTAGGRIDEAALEAGLSTNGIPDPDLIIRTGGNRRLSDFMLWQAAYSELWATPVAWTQFGPDDLDAALAAYALRDRRFGGRTAIALGRVG